MLRRAFMASLIGLVVPPAVAQTASESFVEETLLWWLEKPFDLVSAPWATDLVPIDWRAVGIVPMLRIWKDGRLLWPPRTATSKEPPRLDRALLPHEWHEQSRPARDHLEEPGEWCSC